MKVKCNSDHYRSLKKGDVYDVYKIIGSELRLIGFSHYYNVDNFTNLDGSEIHINEYFSDEYQSKNYRPYDLKIGDIILSNETIYNFQKNVYYKVDSVGDNIITFSGIDIHYHPNDLYFDWSYMTKKKLRELKLKSLKDNESIPILDEDVNLIDLVSEDEKRIIILDESIKAFKNKNRIKKNISVLDWVFDNNRYGIKKDDINKILKISLEDIFNI